MFEIGLSEIVLIAIVALLVVGPREFPTLVRTIGSWLGKARHVMGAVKAEFEREIHKADEIKRLMAREAEIAELHKTLDAERRADRSAPPARTEAPPGADIQAAAPISQQDHGKPQA